MRPLRFLLVISLPPGRAGSLSTQGAGGHTLSKRGLRLKLPQASSAHLRPFEWVETPLHAGLAGDLRSWLRRTSGDDPEGNRPGIPPRPELPRQAERAERQPFPGNGGQTRF